MYYKSFEATASFNKGPSTASYDANDVISSSSGEVLTFSDVLIKGKGGSVLIDYVGLVVNTSSVPSGSSGYKLRLYNDSPTAIADSGAFNLPSTDRSKYQGYININSLSDFGATCVAQNTTSLTQVKLGSTSKDIIGILTTNTSHGVAASATYKVIVRGVGI